LLLLLFETLLLMGTTTEAVVYQQHCYHCYLSQNASAWHLVKVPYTATMVCFCLQRNKGGLASLDAGAALLLRLAQKLL
jgi:hypothetical protein